MKPQKLQLKMKISKEFAMDLFRVSDEDEMDMCKFFTKELIFNKIKKELKSKNRVLSNELNPIEITVTVNTASKSNK